LDFIASGDRACPRDWERETSNQGGTAEESKLGAMKEDTIKKKREEKREMAEIP